MLHTNRNHEFRSKLILFAIEIIKLTKRFPRTPESSIITNQVVKSSTSIGANYAESMFGLTKADFIHCLNICKKETGETLHWLEVILILYPQLSKETDVLRQEAESYLRIFIASVKTAQGKT